MTREEAITELKIRFVGEYNRQREAKDVAIKALELEPCEDIKEYYKDIWDCDVNHPKYEDTVAEIVEKSYISGYAHGVENTAKEFRFELDQEPILDKIRAEIEQLTSRYTLSHERGGMGQVEWSDRLIKESDILQIIDKYKAESEDDGE